MTIADAPVRGASRPRQALPSGAWDCHTHVFGPFERYPLVKDAKYQPPFGPWEHHEKVLGDAGFEHSVVVHASANGYDNSGTLDAVAAGGGHVVGVAVVSEETTDGELEKLHRAGIRGLRFTENGENIAEANASGTLGLRSLQRMLPRLKALGWHAQIWAKTRHVVASRQWLLAGGVPIIVDHMGGIEAARGVRDPDFLGLLDMISSGDLWVKLTATRVSKLRWADCSDARPFHDLFVQRAPDRMVWGSDWPYIAMDKDLPGIGAQIDLFDAWVGDAALRQRILVSNPGRFYSRPA